MRDVLAERRQAGLEAIVLVVLELGNDVVPFIAGGHNQCSGFASGMKDRRVVRVAKALQRPDQSVPVELRRRIIGLGAGIRAVMCVGCGLCMGPSRRFTVFRARVVVRHAISFHTSSPDTPDERAFML